MSLTCPRCEVENRDEAKRCMACNTDLSRVRASSGPRATATRLCPAGRHPMDPNWAVCNYCKAEAEAKRQAPAASPPPPPAPAVRRATVMENSQASPAGPPPSTSLPPSPSPPAPSGAPPKRRRTAFMPSSGGSPEPAAAPPVPPVPAVAAPAVPEPVSETSSARRRTVYASSPSAAPAPPPPAPAAATPAPAPAAAPAPVPAPPPGRRIVGLLVTYSWSSDGQVFPVREGRNYLGSDPECDIAVDRDPQLSGRHATILYRGRGFWIDDEKSMNGTFVEGECVEEKQRLTNYAEIRTGSTVWKFVEVEPSGG